MISDFGTDSTAGFLGVYKSRRPQLSSADWPFTIVAEEAGFPEWKVIIADSKVSARGSSLL